MAVFFSSVIQVRKRQNTRLTNFHMIPSRPVKWTSLFD